MQSFLFQALSHSIFLVARLAKVGVSSKLLTQRKAFESSLNLHTVFYRPWTTSGLSWILSAKWVLYITERLTIDAYRGYTDGSFGNI